MSDKPTILALDFGTTNSLLAAANHTRTFEPIALDPLAADPTILRSALHFTRADDVLFGQAAIKRYIDLGLRGRLLRSVKRHLSSRAFAGTWIDGKRLTIEEIAGTLLRSMRESACLHFDTEVDRVVLGRPARFGERDDAEALAQARLGKAAQLAGFRQVWFCFEPVAAAYDFAAGSECARTVLIADFGGGTSDFTVACISSQAFSSQDVLAVGGVSLAGDAFDGALVRTVAAPLLGSLAPYRLPATTNVLTMPGDLLQLLCSPARLTLADRRRVLESIDGIHRGLLDLRDAARLSRFSTLVADAVGYQFYEAIEAAKVRLSSSNTARLTFPYPGIELDHPVTRSEFATAVALTLERIVAALDQTLATAGVTPESIEMACLTGGTSMVPVLESVLRAKLPAAQVVRLRSHHSVVQGLAHCAQALEQGVATPSVEPYSSTAADALLSESNRRAPVTI
jgi:hypothetical chaperone protein